MSEAGVGWSSGLFDVPGLRRNGDGKGGLKLQVDEEGWADRGRP